MARYNAQIAKNLDTSYCTLLPVCAACGEFHGSAESKLKKRDLSNKTCENCGGSHTANYRACPVYKELKSRIQHKVSGSTIDTFETYPDVFFLTAGRSSLSSSNLFKNVSFAIVLKSNHASVTFNDGILTAASYQPI